MRVENARIQCVSWVDCVSEIYVMRLFVPIYDYVKSQVFLIKSYRKNLKIHVKSYISYMYYLIIFVFVPLLCAVYCGSCGSCGFHRMYGISSVILFHSRIVVLRNRYMLHCMLFDIDTFVNIRSI